MRMEDDIKDTITEDDLMTPIVLVIGRISAAQENNSSRESGFSSCACNNRELRSSPRAAARR